MIDLDAERFEEARARLRQAVEWQRKALAANPANPAYRQLLDNHLTNLITAARGLGDAEGVAEAERELAKLRDSDPAIVALDARLSAVIKGDQQPKDEADRLRSRSGPTTRPCTRRPPGSGRGPRSRPEARRRPPGPAPLQRRLRRRAGRLRARARTTRRPTRPPGPSSASQALDWLKAELVGLDARSSNPARRNKDRRAKRSGHWKETPTSPASATTRSWPS